ncbi:MAG: DUF1816 domain-containing protein [Pseudomonadales bacterium]|nr:DUF1816 domain-containing protein [Pseudomonadales bacterium]
MRCEDDSIADFPFRTHRINCINSQWYFLMRGGENIGPFPTKEDANKHLASYLEKMKAEG